MKGAAEKIARLDRRRILLRVVVILLIAIPALGCDQGTKSIARTGLRPGMPLEMACGVVTLILTENSGAFLSLGARLPLEARALVFRYMTLLFLLLLFVYLVFTADSSRSFLVAGSLILAGGAGNVLDRFLHSGHVTDFIYLELGPAHTGVFNVADMFISAALVLLVLQAGRGRDPRNLKASDQGGV